MKRFNVVVAVLSLLALGSLGAGTAQAGTTLKTTGSIQMSSPVQFASFDAFASNPVKGSISYTNFDPANATVGTGVWVPSAFAMGFAVDPSTSVAATYAMTVTSFTPTSPTSVTFAGTGATSGWNSTFTGAVNGSSLKLAMTEINAVNPGETNAVNPGETYALTASGTIASDGSATGTWSDNYGTGRTGTFQIAAIGYEAFHYVAPMSHVSVVGHDANFDYTIPGTSVVVYTHVHDGGQPGAGHDTWGFTTTLGGTFVNYPIVGGNLTVFS